MNLEGLRAHLQSQATEIDPATPVPLPTIHRQAKTLKRRRTATVLTTTAAAVALVAAVLPNTINNSSPDPVKPPPDYTRHGITIPGTVGPDHLEKAEIGKPGDGPLQFNWTPSGTSIAFRPYCRTTATRPLNVKVTVNGREITTGKCNDSGPFPGDEHPRLPGHILWVEAPAGKPAEVRVSVTDGQTELTAGAAEAQLALGIYRTPDVSAKYIPQAEAGLPVRTLPPGAGDYLKDGIRFRSKVAGDVLLGAAVSDAGQQTVKLRFTATSASTGLRFLCTGDRERFDRGPSLAVSIAGRRPAHLGCSSGRADVALTDEEPYVIQASAGQTVEVTIGLVDKQGRNVTVAGARLGIGAYALHPPRLVETESGRATIDDVIEYGDYVYKLAKVVTMDAASGRVLSLDTPAGKPYVVGYGYGLEANAEPGMVAQVDGLSQQLSFRLGQVDLMGPAKLTGSFGQPAREAGQVTLKMREGRPTKGVFYLALYLPENGDR